MKAIFPLIPEGKPADTPYPSVRIYPVGVISRFVSSPCRPSSEIVPGTVQGLYVSFEPSGVACSRIEISGRNLQNEKESEMLQYVLLSDVFMHSGKKFVFGAVVCSQGQGCFSTVHIQSS